MPKRRTLYIVVCAAGPAGQVSSLVEQAQRRGFDVQVIATPAATDFIDIAALEEQTGRRVRSRHRSPGQPRSPKADAAIIAPASANTINKLANGIADNYALDVLTELIGMGVPVAILPFVNTALVNRHPFDRSVNTLRQEGVTVLKVIGNDVLSGGRSSVRPGQGSLRMGRAAFSNNSH